MFQLPARLNHVVDKQKVGIREKMLNNLISNIDSQSCTGQLSSDFWGGREHFFALDLETRKFARLHFDAGGVAAAPELPLVALARSERCM